MDANRYRELALREAELAEAELERSRSAWLYALSQESEGLRDHFIRIAAQSRFAWTQHQRMAKHFESRAERTEPSYGAGGARARPVARRSPAGDDSVRGVSQS